MGLELLEEMGTHTSANLTGQTVSQRYTDRVVQLVENEFPWTSTSVSHTRHGEVLVVALRYSPEDQSVSDISACFEKCGVRSVGIKGLGSAEPGDTLLKASPEPGEWIEMANSRVRVRPVVGVTFGDWDSEEPCRHPEAEGTTMMLKDAELNVETDGSTTVSSDAGKNTVSDTVITSVTPEIVVTTQPTSPAAEIPPTVVIRHETESETGRDMTTVTDYDVVRLNCDGVTVGVDGDSVLIKDGLVTDVNRVPPRDLHALPDQPTLGSVPSRVGLSD